jgi:hypothetical protein
MALTEHAPTTIVDPALAGIAPRYDNFVGGDFVRAEHR